MLLVLEPFKSGCIAIVRDTESAFDRLTNYFILIIIIEQRFVIRGMANQVRWGSMRSVIKLLPQGGFPISFLTGEKKKAAEEP